MYMDMCSRYSSLLELSLSLPFPSLLISLLHFPSLQRSSMHYPTGYICKQRGSRNSSSHGRAGGGGGGGGGAETGSYSTHYNM